MSGMYGHNREAVRVKVKKCEKNIPSETRKFSVDPQITNLEVLYSLLAKAFDLKTDFGISYKVIEANGQESYLVVLSDWDLEAAFLRAHNQSIASKCEPCLNLRVDIKPFSETSDWDGAGTATNAIPRELVSLQQSIGAGQKYVQNKLPGLIMNQMEKTFSLVQRAFNLAEDPLLTQPIRPPLADAEFRKLQDSVGQIVAPEQLRKAIYLGGIDPSLRRVVWKHILNVYPDGMTGRERMEYMKKKSAEYYRLRDVWRSTMQRGNIAGELAYVTSMVRKDVLRTDRLHPFYAGSDDNQNIAALFNVLTTYALNHPAVSYCQGMSDIASPLLVTMGDEAQAYICFCAIMERLSCNFMLDGIAMTLKFSHLSEALQYYDPDFFAYLKHHQADDLLFCYRWLLLEMKREFAFDDALRMLEVLWSSLPPRAPRGELELYEKEYEPPPLDENSHPPPSQSPSVMLRTPRENPYTKVCALRRQSSALSLSSSCCTSTNPPSSRYGTGGSVGLGGRLDATRRLNLSLDENITRENIYSNRGGHVQKVHQSLDEAKIALVKQRKIVRSVGDDEDIQEVDVAQQHPREEEDNATDVEDNVFHSPQHQPNSKAPPYGSRSNPFFDDSLESICPPEPEVEIERVPESPHDFRPESSTPATNSSSAASSVRNSPVIGRSRSLFSTSAATGKLIARQLSNQKKHFTGSSGSAGGAGNGSGAGVGHFHDLKEKLAASRKGIFGSLDKSAEGDRSTAVDGGSSTRLGESHGERVKPKLVKNFNEFLSFAAMNKSRISDRLTTKKLLASATTVNASNGNLNNTGSIDSTTSSYTTTGGIGGASRNDSTDTIEYNELKPKPVIKLTKSSFDDSDSSATSVGVPLDSIATTAALSRSSDNSSFIVDDSSASVSPIHVRKETSVEHKEEDGSAIIHRPEELFVGGTFAPAVTAGDGSSPDDSQEYFPMTTSMTRELRLELENLDRHVFGNDFHSKQQRFYTLSSCIDMETPPESGDSLGNAGASPTTAATVEIVPDTTSATSIAYSKLDNNGSLPRSVDTTMEIQSIEEICDRSEARASEQVDDCEGVASVVVRYREKPGRRRQGTGCPSSTVSDNRDSKRISTSSANVTSSDVFVWENPLHQECGDDDAMSPVSGGVVTGDVTQIQQRTATTPDEHPELEYDGEIIEETTLGKKSVTPIRLVRRNGDRSVPCSARNSMILPDSSDSSGDSPLSRSPAAVKFKFHPNNPFFDAESSAIDNRPVMRSLQCVGVADEELEESGPLEEATEASAIIGGSNDTLLIKTLDTTGERGERKTMMASSSSASVEPTQLDVDITGGVAGNECAPTIPTPATVPSSMKIAGVLPPPLEFGGGNPFLMFLSLTILLQHRDYIMKTGMDYNEMAMHFDKMVRKHNVTRVLNQARQMYAEYRRLYQQQLQAGTAVSRASIPGSVSMMASSFHGTQSMGLSGGTLDNLLRKASAPEVSSARRNTGGDLTLVT
uniref:Rab-GAP TBC domain-containing protein n=1 Tax=Anopheles atroparvus TaxID=41427 RepID=A0AAG5CWW4_ANOAO